MKAVDISAPHPRSVADATQFRSTHEVPRASGNPRNLCVPCTGRVRNNPVCSFDRLSTYECTSSSDGERTWRCIVYLVVGGACHANIDTFDKISRSN